MTKGKILIIEDEVSLARFIELELTFEGYEVSVSHDGREGYEMFESQNFDLILLDLMLPGIDGIEICKRIRKISNVPVIILTAKDDVSDKVAGLDSGASDYITKPFGTSELLARIRTALRHASTANAATPAEAAVFQVGDLTIDYERRRIVVRGNEVHLTQNEFKIVSLLSRHAGKVLTHDFIIKEIWGPGLKGDNQILRVNMANIRRKIEKNPGAPEYILTEVGVGYRMAEGDS